MYSLKPCTNNSKAIGAVAGYHISKWRKGTTIQVLVKSWAESRVTKAVSVDILLEAEGGGDG